ncbi:MAG: hypothetical protein AB4062_10685 [Crocosphaera sp.]
MSEENQTLPQKKLYSSDPLASFLIDRFHVTPFKLALGVTLLSGCLSIFIAGITQTLYFKPGVTYLWDGFSYRECQNLLPAPNYLLPGYAYYPMIMQPIEPGCVKRVGLFNDWIRWVMILVATPCISWSYLWSYQAIYDLLEGLKLSNIVTINDSNINSLILNLYSKKWRKYLALVIAIISSIGVFDFSRNHQGSWADSHILARINIVIATFIIVYMAVIFLLNLRNNLLILSYIFTKTDIDINPLHPDGCGGLRFLSQYSLKMAYISIILGIWFGAVQYQIWEYKDNPIYLQLILSSFFVIQYFCCSIISLLSPRLIVSKQIKTGKNKLLTKISDELNKIDLDLENVGNLQEQKNKIEELTILYNTIDKFSPLFFDIKYLGLYFSALPILSQVAGFLLPQLSGKLLEIIQDFLSKTTS